MILLTFLNYSPGEDGCMEGPFTTIIGVFTTKEEIAKAKAKLPHIEKEFHAQFGSGMAEYVETPLTLNTILK